MVFNVFPFFNWLNFILNYFINKDPGPSFEAADTQNFENIIHCYKHKIAYINVCCKNKKIMSNLGDNSRGGAPRKKRK